MRDILDEIENLNREWQAGRAKRAIFDAADAGAADAEWRNARNVAAELDGAPDLPEWETEAA